MSPVLTKYTSFITRRAIYTIASFYVILYLLQANKTVLSFPFIALSVLFYNFSTKNQEESNEDEARPKIIRKLNSRQRRRKRERERRLKMLVSDRSNNTPALELRSSENSKTRKRKSQPIKNDTYHKLAQLDPSRLEAYGLKPKKVLKKAKYGLSNGNQI